MNPAIMSWSIFIQLAAMVVITVAVPAKEQQQHWRSLRLDPAADRLKGQHLRPLFSARHPRSTAEDHQKAHRLIPLPESADQSQSWQQATLKLLQGSPAAPRRPPLQIVGGRGATLGEYPSHVSLRYGKYHVCSGSLIAADYVLTAFQCVVGFMATELRIVAGSVDLGSVGGQTHYVTEIIPHPYADLETIENDIALLRLSSAVRCNADVQIIPFHGPAMCGGETAVATGWGLTSFPDPITRTDLLQSVDLPILSHSECLQKVHPLTRPYVHGSSLCTLGAAGKGVCHGDTGGPLVVDGQLVGIVSWYIACAVGYPDVFVRVSSYVTWIDSIIYSGHGGCGCGGGSCARGCASGRAR